VVSPKATKMASLVAQGIYRFGSIIFQLKEADWDANKEMDTVLTELDDKVGRARVKEISILLRTGRLLLGALENEAKHLQEKTSDISSDDPFALHVKGLVDSVNTYLTTVGVVAALLLGISIPWILTPLEQSSILLASNTSSLIAQEGTMANVNTAMVILMVISASFSMLVLIVSFGMYGSLNVSIASPIDRLWFLRTHSISVCEVYIVISVASLCASVLLGLYVVYGEVPLAIACAFVGSISIHYLVFVLKLMSTTHNRLIAKFRAQISELRAQYDEFSKRAPNVPVIGQGCERLARDATSEPVSAANRQAGPGSPPLLLHNAVSDG
jgi:hypothetical protein